LLFAVKQQKRAEFPSAGELLQTNKRRTRGGVAMRVFLKFRSEVKKVEDCPQTLVEVKKLFPEKFDSIKVPAFNFPIYVQVTN